MLHNTFHENIDSNKKKSKLMQVEELKLHAGERIK